MHWVVKWFKIILLTIILTSCSSFINPITVNDVTNLRTIERPIEFPLNIFVTNEFTEDENIIIDKALRDWEAKFSIITYNVVYNWEPAEKFSRFIYKDKEYISVWKKSEYDSSIIDLQVRYSIIADGFSIGDFIIIVEDDGIKLTSNKLYTVFKHEFGHTLGLNHIENEYPALMNGGGNNGIITRYDKFVFCSLYNCKM